MVFFTIKKHPWVTDVLENKCLVEVLRRYCNRLELVKYELAPDPTP